MAKASFVHPNATLTFSRSPLRPDNGLTVIQPQRQSAGGLRFGFASTLSFKIIKLTLRMTTAEKDTLLAFFNTTVNGMAETFTYNDTAGVALTARFNQPRLDGLVEKAGGSYEITVELRVAA